MKIERKPITTDVERKIALGMVTSTPFLREISIIYDEQLIVVPYVRTIGEWCVQHFKTYREAPQQKIENVHASALRRNKIPEKEKELLEEFLATLSEEWERDGFNAEFWLDEAERYLDGRRLLLISEDAQAHVSRGNYKEARELIEGYRQIKRPGGGAVNPFNKEVITTAFEESQESLFRLPGAVGFFMNHLLVRNSLIGVLAPEKRGKTFLLTELALIGVKFRCNVALFAVGDMSRDQMVRRIGVRITNRSLLDSKENERQVVYDCQRNQRGTCDKTKGSGGIEDEDGEVISNKDHLEAYLSGTKHKPCDACRKERNSKWRGARWWKPIDSRRLTLGKAKRAGAKFMKAHGNRLKLYEYGTWQLNVKMVEAELERLKEQEDFLADIVIIDYADNLGAEDTRVHEERHKQNQTWGALSALRNKWNCCLITATQDDAGTYDGSDITMKNFTEDKRKLGHVTAMIAINQTPQEKKERIARLGTVVARETEFHIDKQVVIMQHLLTGKALLGSYRR